MDNLDWSLNARRVIRHFFEADIVVYVEGDDDITFWDIVFSEFTKKKFKLKPVGGKNTLLKYLNERCSDDTFLVAMDSDYDKLNGTLDSDAAILTYGYSIENTVVTITVIESLIATYSDMQLNHINRTEIIKWVEDFEKAVTPLLAADILNREAKITDQQVIPDRAARFYENDTLIPIDSKIRNHLIELGFNVEALEDDLKLHDYEVIEMVKGHFLFTSFLHFVKKHSDSSRDKAISIPTEAFYSTCIMGFKNSFNDNHPHYLYYKNMISYHLDNVHDA